MASAQTPLRVLSLDGGGVRGLSELIILEELMLKIQEQSKAATPPKPCDIFDMICGTSTGGIIALMLGRLRMTVKEVQDQYCEIAEKVFGHPKKGIGKGRDQFSATELEKVMKETIAKYSSSSTSNKTGDPDLLLLEGSQDAVDCKVFVCTRNARAMKTTRLFRSYQVFETGTYQDEMKVWQAGRATSAAPTFFKRLKIGHKNAQEEFLDGGLGSNNPTNILLEEMVKIYGNHEVSCIVSIGAGKARIAEYKIPGFFGKLIPKELIDALKKMATDCETTEGDMSKKFLKRGGVYFRFSVEHGLEEVGLEEWKELCNITAKTHEYLRDHKLVPILEEAVQKLFNPSANLKVSDLNPSLPNNFTSLIASNTTSYAVNRQTGNANDVEDCHQSLEFAQIDTRKDHIRSAFSTTYQWLLGQDATHPLSQASPFLQWLLNPLEYDNIFWLSGKAGSGKSTLMKFLHGYPEFRGLLGHWMVSRKLSCLAVAGFYFYERGESALQKSREGLLRSLLHTLLVQVPTLKHIVLQSKVSSSASQQTEGRTMRVMYTWTWDDLKTALLRFLQHKPSDLGVYLFADGLDEYLSAEALEQNTTHDDEDDGRFASAKRKGHREIADFFLELCRYPNTKICLSSRPLAIFENRFGGFPYLKLEDLTKKDIELYFGETFHQANKNHSLTTKDLDNIVRMTVNAASGVFLWVELVVAQLADRLIDGDRAEELERRLHNTPEELGGEKGLYMQMLQNILPTDRQQGQLFFEVVRRARHQVSPLILSFCEDSRESILQTPVQISPDEDLRARLLQTQSRLKSRCAGLLELQQGPLGRGETANDPCLQKVTLTLSDQLKSVAPLHIHKTVVVNYYHQTVKEFLQSRSVQRVLKENFTFDYTLLVQACVQCIKCLSYDLDDFGILELWSHLKDALFYAERAEVATGKADTVLLDHLDEVAEVAFRSALQSPRSQHLSFRESVQDFLSGNSHWIVLEPDVWGRRLYDWGDNFLSWAVHANLCCYIKTKISATDYQRKPGRPLLAYAVVPGVLRNTQHYDTLYYDYFGSSISSLAMIRVLLEHGESPNDRYCGFTIWEWMWNSLLSPKRFSSSDMSAVLQIMHLMIEKGADPNARVMFKLGWKARYWYLGSCLFAVLAKLEGPQTARLEIVKLLAGCGAQFYTGEKVSIEQDREFQWTWLFVKDCRERDAPTYHELVTWRDEMDRARIRD